MVELCTEIKNIKYIISKLRDGNLVLQRFLDPCMQNSVEAEKWFGGISKCLIEFLLSIKEHGNIRSLNPMPRVYINEMGMGSQQFSFNQKKRSPK